MMNSENNMFRKFRKTMRYFFIAGGIVLIVLVGFIYENQLKIKGQSNVSTVSIPMGLNSSASNVSNSPSVQAPSANASVFVAPISQASQRVTKKPFGIYVTPQNSPVQPERFTGFHTGTDFETFPSELNQPVQINAICNGKIQVREWASGYGGVVVEICTYNNQPITVVYGHLNISSVSKNVGDSLNAGDKIGILGDAYSQQTDGERKHLHLGIHKGSATNILGYVQSQSQLSGWYNGCDLGVCQ
jgi:murein DD-endopeptidase MepM/ murein hydrolase activator NlpD